MKYLNTNHKKHSLLDHAGTVQCCYTSICSLMSDYKLGSSLPSNRRWYKDDLCALAFKVLHDKQRGPLVFLRIYSGTLKPQTAVHNINRNSMYVVTIANQS